MGHPLLEKDPRVQILEQEVNNYKKSYKLMDVYQELKDIMSNNYHLFPNIDVVSALIFKTLHIESEIGSALFIFARIPVMIAHAREKKEKPAFGFKRAEAREKFKRFPVDWI